MPQSWLLKTVPSFSLMSKDDEMARKRHSDEDILRLLREIECIWHRAVTFRRLAGRVEARQLKEALAEVTLENRLLKKSVARPSSSPGSANKQRRFHPCG